MTDQLIEAQRLFREQDVMIEKQERLIQILGEEAKQKESLQA